MSGKVAVRLADDGFVEISRETLKFDVLLRSTLAFDRAHLEAFRAALASLAESFSPSESGLDCGDDHFEFVIGGAEHDPVINVFNHRASALPRGGDSVVALPSGNLAGLLDELHRI